MNVTIRYWTCALMLDGKPIDVHPKRVLTNNAEQAAKQAVKDWLSDYHPLFVRQAVGMEQGVIVRVSEGPDKFSTWRVIGDIEPRLEAEEIDP